jgi:hypothetical protein
MQPKLSSLTISPDAPRLLYRMGVWVRLRLLPTLGGGGGGDDIAARVYGGASGGETERGSRARRGSRRFHEPLCSKYAIYIYIRPGAKIQKAQKDEGPKSTVPF